MVHNPTIHLLTILIISASPSLIHSQQLYIRRAATKCGQVDNSSSKLGYTCNGLNAICKSYLTFRSQPPFNSVSSIAKLLSVNQSELSSLNSVTKNWIFELNKIVLVPINCSCSGQYYQANTSYTVKHEDTRFLIANNTFQGLSTCHAVIVQNSNLTRNIYSGSNLTIPLRCACPTKNQIDVGINYLMTYLVTWGDTVSSIGMKFGADVGRTLEANGIPENDATLYPFTTLLIPMQNPPSSSQTLAPPSLRQPPSLPPPPAYYSRTNSNKKWVYVLVGVLGVLSLVSTAGVVVFCFIFFRRKRRANVVTSPKITYTNYEKKFDQETGFLDRITSAANSLKLYNFEELESATANFSSSSLIKGSVYRGTINGDMAVIKKVNGDVSKEINILHKINHINLVLLSGVCFNDGYSYLVYEYAENGSLSGWIYCNQENQMFLNWIQRIQIALDVATGLNYLHSYTNPPYVHRDLTACNILLDKDFRAKIANFNLARSAQGQNGLFDMTKEIVGTKGYMAPEYLEHGFVSSKLDIYAFGVLMTQIFGGDDDANLNLEEPTENVRNFVNISLHENFPTDLAMFVARLTSRCLEKDPFNRPETDEIVQILSRTLAASLLQLAKKNRKIAVASRSLHVYPQCIKVPNNSKQNLIMARNTAKNAIYQLGTRETTAVNLFNSFEVERINSI